MEIFTSTETMVGYGNLVLDLVGILTFQCQLSPNE